MTMTRILRVFFSDTNKWEVIREDARRNLIDEIAREKDFLSLETWSKEGRSTAQQVHKRKASPKL